MNCSKINTPEFSFKNIGHTIRRYYVDKFYFSNLSNISPEKRVLDLGGNKVNKRGQFNIEFFTKNVTYLNLSTEKTPDVQAAAENIPFKNNSFDVIICSELLEHVSTPTKVIAEIFRVTNTNGKVFITAPFLYHIHADPYDYGRYTNIYWQETLKSIGFKNIIIEPQGAFFCVLMEMLRTLANRFIKRKKLTWIPINPILKLFIRFGIRMSIKLDNTSKIKTDELYSRYTTGFEMTAIKPK